MKAIVIVMAKAAAKAYQTLAHNGVMANAMAIV
jgi:hypothetical protein